MIGLAIGALIVAALCALGDGALQAADAPGGGKILPAAERAHRALALLRVVALAAGGVAAALLADVAGRPPAAAVLLAVAIVVGGTIVADSIPRALGDAFAPRVLARLAPAMRALGVIGSPMVSAQATVDRVLARAIPAAAIENEKAVAEQFREIVAAEAEVSREERSLLLGVFSLAETEVHEIMVPRVEVVGIDQETPWSEVVDRVRSSEHARFPVYDGTLDDVVGIMYTKDVIPFAVTETEPAGDWTGLVRPAVFIPATKRLDVQLRDFQASGTHIAIVVDEYGGTAGLVTIEDILEEIVGDIRDEYDVEEPAIESEDGVRWWVSARLTLGELSEAVAHDFRHEQVSTVGGLLYELLGRVPLAGESISLDGFRIVVEKMSGRRVRRVFFERVGAPVEREEVA